MVRLCQYKDILGKSREGVHSIRILDFAIVDILLTVIAAFIISKFTNINFLKTLIFLILLAIFLHWLFCVDTKLNQILFSFF